MKNQDFLSSLQHELSYMQKRLKTTDSEAREIIKIFIAQIERDIQHNITKMKSLET